VPARLRCAGLPTPSQALVEWAARQGLLRRRLQPRLVAAQLDQDGDEEDDGHAQGDPAQRVREPLHVVPKQVAPEPGERRPHDTPRRVEGQEAAPRQAIRARQKRCLRAQDRDKVPEQHHLPAMLAKQVDPQLQRALIQPDEGAVAAHEAEAPLARPTQKPRLSPRMAPAAAAVITPGMARWCVVSAETEAAKSIVLPGNWIPVLLILLP
jgi:hypothetical protein